MRNLSPYIFLLSITALTTLGACCPDDYYCDNTACYYCDGLGCREVETPPRPTCRGDFECTEGVCTDLGCISECGPDAECADGYVCADGLCVEPTEPIPMPMPGSCVRNADCGDSLLVCRDGMCITDPNQCGATGCGCGVTGVCAAGFFCIDDECRAEENVCHFNTECGERTCVDGRCVGECSGPSDCLAEEMCVDDFCVARPPTTGECTDDASCGEARVCIDSSCYAECDAERACSEGLYCDAGRCRVDDRPRPACTGDEMCRFACINGVCRTPCDTSEECARVAVEFGFCLENFCATTNEATSNCARSSECDTGRSCVDGICR